MGRHWTQRPRVGWLPIFIHSLWKIKIVPSGKSWEWAAWAGRAYCRLRLREAWRKPAREYSVTCLTRLDRELLTAFFARSLSVRKSLSGALMTSRKTTLYSWLPRNKSKKPFSILKDHLSSFFFYTFMPANCLILFLSQTHVVLSIQGCRLVQCCFWVNLISLKLIGYCVFVIFKHLRVDLGLILFFGWPFFFTEIGWNLYLSKLFTGISRSSHDLGRYCFTKINILMRVELI